MDREFIYLLYLLLNCFLFKKSTYVKKKKNCNIFIFLVIINNISIIIYS